MKTEQKPIITREETYGNDIQEISRHPAFGLLGISRVTGSQKLFGSEVKNGGFIEIHIAPAEEIWHLHRKRYSKSKADIISVSMSYAQFAEAITNLNCGDGIPCTINRLNGERIPDIAEDEITVEDQYKLDVQEYVEKINKTTNEMMNQIAELKVSGKQKENLIKSLEKVKRELNSNLPFVISQCEEAVEHITAKSKIEVEAFAQNRIHQLGMEALAIKNADLQIENGK